MTSSDPMPFHPAYGLTDETRRKILEDAETFGVAKAADMHRVSLSAVYRWRQRLAEQPAN